jgi:hypothetical protein
LGRFVCGAAWWCGSLANASLSGIGSSTVRFYPHFYANCLLLISDIFFLSEPLKSAAPSIISLKLEVYY